MQPTGILLEYERRFQAWITESSTESVHNDENRCAGPRPVAFLPLTFLCMCHEPHLADLSLLIKVPESACLRDPEYFHHSLYYCVQVSASVLSPTIWQHHWSFCACDTGVLFIFQNYNTTSKKHCELIWFTSRSLCICSVLYHSFLF